MNRLTAVVSAMLICMTSAARDFVCDGISYTVISETDKTCKTKGGMDSTPGNNATGELAIPPQVTDGTDQFTVTAIGENAFCWTSLTKISLPSTITEIGQRAFWMCGSLTGISMPESLVAIGPEAFMSCWRLTDLVLPESVRTIGGSAFMGCNGLTDVRLPESLTEIARYTFAQCEGLKTIYMPDGILSIADFAFQDCSGLTEIKLPASLTAIGIKAFKGCTGIDNISLPAGVTSLGAYAFSEVPLTTITIPPAVSELHWAFQECCTLKEISVDAGNPNFTSAEGVLFSKDMTRIIQYPCAREAKEYSIPSSVADIADYSFAHCANLTNLIIPNSVIGISDWAFGYCTGLEEIDLPDSVLGLGNCAFAHCTGLTSVRLPMNLQSVSGAVFSGCERLTSVNISEDSQYFTSLDGVLFNKQMSEVVLYPVGRQGEYTIPSTVTKIGRSSFGGCNGLTSVTIPNSVTIIGNVAFNGCTALENLDIPDSVTDIEAIAFADCRNLRSIVLGGSVRTIGSGAFNNCPDVRHVTSRNPEPPEVLLIPPKNSAEEPENDLFSPEVFMHAELIVPEGSVDAYRAAAGWKDFKSITGMARIEEVASAEDTEDVPAVYYDMQGIRVGNPSSGFYIVRRGLSVTKEYVR